MQQVQPVTTPNFDQGVCFLSYSTGCIALQKLTHEISQYWQKEKIPFVIFDQSQFANILPNPWGTLVLHRGGTHNWNSQVTPQFMEMLKQRKDGGTRLVYYIDDFLIHQNNNLPIHLMRMSDTVIAKGYLLPDYLRNVEGLTNVEQLKTWINLEIFDNADLKPVPFERPFNLLWFSAGGTGLGLLPEILEEMSKTPDIWKDTSLHCIGTGCAYFRAKLNRFRDIHKVYAEKISLEGLYQLVKSCDIVVNPLHPDTDNMELAHLPAHRKWFNDSKVEIKYIIAGAGAKPLITSSSAAYKQCIKQGKNGYVTDDPAEWAKILARLKKNKGTRTKLGNAARKDVEANYEAALRWPRIKKLILGK